MSRSWNGVPRSRGALAALGLAALLGGCALLTPSGPPPATFDLSAPARGRAVRHGGAVMVVSEPTALSALDSERIMARPSPMLINYFGASQWSDRLPALVQARIIQAFEDAAWLRAVGRPDQGLSADYRLLSDIRTFEVEVGSTPRAVIEISAKLVSEREGRIVAARLFRASVPAASKEVEAGVVALDAALGQVLVEMVSWASRRNVAPPARDAAPEAASPPS